MSGWLVGRLVSGLGVATKAAVLPLTRQTATDLVSSCLTPTACSMWRCWSVPDQAFLSTSAVSSAQASLSAMSEASAAAAAAAPSTSASGASASGASDNPASSSSGDAAALEAAQQPPSAPLPDPKPDLVDKFLSTEVLGLEERRRLERQAVVRDFQRHPADTGSPQVMVAVMTHRLRELVQHFDSNRKQLPAMRHLEILVNQRRRLLTWLRDADFESYSYTIAKLGLRDIYTPTGFSDRYREGLRPSDPVPDDSVNRLRFNFHTKYRQKKASLWQRLRPQLVAEDPYLQATDAAAAAAAKQRQQQQRVAAAQQRL
ncbi:hypothetical protein Agub_g8359 [Astrephomene gubernaculifera]|uniref:Small ribosomal subunit protein uS15c n=1 Tax=Astrephomene gubernaculifera TaxID=47775 RepID=A0AAD3DRK1_9CHLO|nr:hypothetical protein Agub_g8359 [Astrephomene gubernaculifera]